MIIDALMITGFIMILIVLLVSSMYFLFEERVILSIGLFALLVFILVITVLNVAESDSRVIDPKQDCVTKAEHNGEVTVCTKVYR